MSEGEFDGVGGPLVVGAPDGVVDGLGGGADVVGG
jgi:hypothetical protein